MKTKDILKMAINKWGLTFQLDMLQEECAELIQAVNKYKRKKPNSFINLVEELVDVEIMMNQIFIAVLIGHDAKEYIKIKRKKLKRLHKLISEE